MSHTLSHWHLRVYCHTFVSLVHSTPLLAKQSSVPKTNCRPRPSIVNQTPMILYRPVYTVTAPSYSLAQFSFRNSDYVHRLQFQLQGRRPTTQTGADHNQVYQINPYPNISNSCPIFTFFR